MGLNGVLNAMLHTNDEVAFLIFRPTVRLIAKLLINNNEIKKDLTLSNKHFCQTICSSNGNGPRVKAE